MGSLNYFQFSWFLKVISAVFGVIQISRYYPWSGHRIWRGVCVFQIFQDVNMLQLADLMFPVCRAYYWPKENIKFYEDIQTAEAAHSQQGSLYKTQHRGARRWRWLTPITAEITSRDSCFNLCLCWWFQLSERWFLFVFLLYFQAPWLYLSQLGWPDPKTRAKLLHNQSLVIAGCHDTAMLIKIRKVHLTA